MGIMVQDKNGSQTRKPGISGAMDIAGRNVFKGNRIGDKYLGPDECLEQDVILT